MIDEQELETQEMILTQTMHKKYRQRLEDEDRAKLLKESRELLALSLLILAVTDLPHADDLCEMIRDYLDRSS